MAFSVRGVQELIETDPDYADYAIGVIDLENAHNTFLRAETLRVLESEPNLRHLTSAAAARLAPYSGLESGGKVRRRWNSGRPSHRRRFRHHTAAFLGVTGQGLPVWRWRCHRRS